MERFDGLREVRISRSPVPAATPGRRIILPVDQTNGYGTSVAFVNTLDDGPVSLTFRSEAGTMVFTDEFQTYTGEHFAYSFAAEYPQTQGMRETVEIVSKAPNRPGIAALAIRFNPTEPATVVQPSYVGN